MSAYGDEHEIEASRAPLLDHLVELRSRLIVCSAAMVVGFLLCFFFSTDIYVFLLAPFERAQGMIALQKAPAITDRLLEQFCYAFAA